MAKDITGRELAAGQNVAYCVAGKSQYMRIGKISIVHKNTVELEERAYPSSEWGIRRNHSAVCIIE